jgi:hypothetical protein
LTSPYYLPTTTNGSYGKPTARRRIKVSKLRNIGISVGLQHLVEISLPEI